MDNAGTTGNARFRPAGITGNLLQNTAFRMALILLLGILAYSNTFDVPFVFDDKPNIVENPLIKDFKYIMEPSRAKEAVMESDILNFGNRVVGYLTFALNWHAHGLDVRGYHVVKKGLEELADKHFRIAESLRQKGR